MHITAQYHSCTIKIICLCVDFGVISSPDPSSYDFDLLNYDSGIEAEIEENKGQQLISMQTHSAVRWQNVQKRI